MNVANCVLMVLFQIKFQVRIEQDRADHPPLFVADHCIVSCNDYIVGGTVEQFSKREQFKTYLLSPNCIYNPLFNVKKHRCLPIFKLRRFKPSESVYKHKNRQV